MRLTLFGGFYFGKMWKNTEKQPFFLVATAGLGTYCMGSYGRIGVYRVKASKSSISCRLGVVVLYVVVTPGVTVDSSQGIRPRGKVNRPN